MPQLAPLAGGHHRRSVGSPAACSNPHVACSCHFTRRATRFAASRDCYTAGRTGVPFPCECDSVSSGASAWSTINANRFISYSVWKPSFRRMLVRWKCTV